MTISAYHSPDAGPDGLCRIAGCGRTRAMHLRPDVRAPWASPLLDARTANRRASFERPDWADDDAPMGRNDGAPVGYGPDVRLIDRI